MSDVTLSGIYIYPVKSLGGISLDTAHAEGKGFPLDRCWMLVDDEGKFLSQRKLPQMATFRVSLKADSIEITHSGDVLNIPIRTETQGYLEVNLWESRFNAPKATKSFNEWFSNHLGRSCTLVVLDETVKRQVDGKYALNDDFVSFADAFPYLIIGESSLQDLNSRLEKSLPMNRFRPNLVCSGGPPFMEDNLDTFQIGEAIFKVMKSCARCVVTTVDQLSGIKGKEPLITLASYRNTKNKVLFGQNLLCLKNGQVNIGDKMIIHSSK